MDMNKIKLMTNYGLAGEEITPGLVKTVHFARNGIFETKSGSWVGKSTVKASDYVLNGSNILDEMNETFELKEMAHKLPFEAFAATYHFYKYVTDLNGSEAQINFYINEKNIEEIKVDGEVLKIKDIKGVDYWSDNVLSYVPIQSNHGALTSTTDPIYIELRRVMKPFIETHSHNTMSAFKSGTDKANSEIEGLQLVFGHLKSPKYDFKSWVTISGSQFDDLEHEELSKFIDMPETIGDIEELGTFEVPAEWLEQCTFSSYVPRRNKFKSHRTFNGYQGSHQYRNKGNKRKGYFNDYEDIWAEYYGEDKTSQEAELDLFDEFNQFIPVKTFTPVEGDYAFDGHNEYDESDYWDGTNYKVMTDEELEAEYLAELAAEEYETKELEAQTSKVIGRKELSKQHKVTVSEQHVHYFDSPSEATEINGEDIAKAVKKADLKNKVDSLSGQVNSQATPDKASTSKLVQVKKHTASQQKKRSFLDRLKLK